MKKYLHRLIARYQARNSFLPLVTLPAATQPFYF